MCTFHDFHIMNKTTVIPQDDGFMDCWIIWFEFKKNHRYVTVKLGN